MSVDITIYARRGLEIVSEFPSNGYNIRLRPIKSEFAEAEGHHFDLYGSLELWWRLRQILPKAQGYEMTGDWADDKYGRFSDWPAADAYAEEFRNRELAKMTPPEPNESVTEMLQSLPVVGTLNVDTNKFTPAPGYGLDGKRLDAPQMKPVIDDEIYTDEDKAFLGIDPALQAT